MTDSISYAFFSPADAFLPFLAEVALKSTLVFLLAACVVLWMRAASAATRHLIWGMTFLGFLLLPALSLTLPKYGVFPSSAASPNRAVGLAQRGGLIAVREPSPDATTTRANAGLPQTSPLNAELRTGSTAPSIETPTLSRVAFAVWLIGAVSLLLRIVVHRHALHREIRVAEPINDESISETIMLVRSHFRINARLSVWMSPQCETPMAWGILQQHIVLPAQARDWDRRRLRAVLLHEMAHIKSRDTLTHVITQAICALYWFHPLVWLSGRQLHLEREQACDDLVLDSGIKPSDYAEQLLQVLTKRSAPSATLAMTRRSGLERRLRTILSDDVSRTPMTRRRFRFGLCIGVVITALLAILGPQVEGDAQQPAPPAATRADASGAARTDAPGRLRRVSVTCLDSDGDPVAGAEVHLLQATKVGEGHRYVQSGPFTSDERGTAICPEALFFDELGRFDRWIYARVPGQFVGVARCLKSRHIGEFNREHQVRLFPSRSVEGMVNVPKGFDPRDVLVRVQTLSITTGPERMQRESLPRSIHFPGMEESLSEIFDARPDANGKVRFEDVPVRGHLHLVTVAEGLGEAQWRTREERIDRPIEIEIEKESSVIGTVLTPRGRPATGMRVAARLEWSGRMGPSYLSTFQTVTDEAGRFEISGLPYSEFTLSISDPDKRLTFRPMENQLVQTGRQESLKLRMEDGVRVSGRVFDPDGNPVEGASFSAIADSTIGSALSHCVTDANGHYEFRLPGGPTRLYFNSVPEGFDYPRPQVVDRFEVAPGDVDIDNLNFTIPRRKPDQVRSESS